MANEIEVRCPSSFGKLFVKLRHEGKTPKVVEGNLMEFSCQDCRRQLGKDLVLHRYNLAGELVETLVSDRTTQGFET